MFTIMEHEANLETGSTSSDARSQTNEYDATDDNNASFLRKDCLFKNQLHQLAARDVEFQSFRVSSFSIFEHLESRSTVHAQHT